MDFVFWQNILSPHQAPFLRELAELGHTVTVVAPEEMTQQRKILGWTCPDLGKSEIVINPSSEGIRALVNNSSADAIHVLAGARWTPLGAIATKACIAGNRRMGILTEAADPRGVAGKARFVKYIAERIWRGRHYSFLLTMGQLGADWFSCCGYAQERIFPFAYVTDDSKQSIKKLQNPKFRFVFVGQLIPRKGVDVLIYAFSRVVESELVVIGNGSERQELEALSQKCGVSERVSWLGSMGATEVQDYIISADVLVLPSREDGWGAVVNEALMVGTPVICTNACGAADLIQYPWLGTAVPSENVDALSKALSEWVRRGSLGEQERERIRDWAQCISGETIAKYFVELVQHVYAGGGKPEAPWRVENTKMDP